MAQLGAYILSVTAGAMFCSILTTLIGKDTAIGSVIRLLTGLVMALIVIRPVLGIELSGLERYWNSFHSDAERFVAQGEEYTQNAMADQVKHAAQEKILQYASESGLDVQVSVTVEEGSVPVPSLVSVSGDAAPYARQTLTKWIAENFGIGEEDVIWNGIDSGSP